jgi:hypothetical protein
LVAREKESSPGPWQVLEENLPEVWEKEVGFFFI